MYADVDFKTKKEFREAVNAGKQIRLFAPGLGTPATDGMDFVEGPHFPKPHTWYAEVLMKNGVVFHVK